MVTNLINLLSLIIVINQRTPNSLRNFVHVEFGGSTIWQMKIEFEIFPFY